MEEPAVNAAPGPESAYRRDEDFASLYANNVKFERSLFDFKMVFGELDQSDENHTFVQQHTAVTVPWIQAKLMAYYIELNLAIHEADFGTIRIPDSMIPPAPASYLTPEMFQTNPQLEYHARFFTLLYERFFGPFKPQPARPQPEELPEEPTR